MLLVSELFELTYFVDVVHLCTPCTGEDAKARVESYVAVTPFRSTCSMK